MKHTLKRREDGSLEITMTFLWKDVQAAYAKAFDHAAGELEVPGFRKGKAPKDIAQKHVNSATLYEEAIGKLIPPAYEGIIKDEKLKPIIHPKIELTNAKEKEDWTVQAITCEKPKVTVGDFKKAIRNLKAGKHKKIWVPGQKEEKEEKKEEGPNLDMILQAVFETVTATIPQILIDHEVNKQLSDLVDRTKQLGLSVEQYLASTGKTIDQMKKEYADNAKRTLTQEFGLEEISDTENVSVSDEEIDKVIKDAKTEDERKALAAQRYYLASLLRRQKTLQLLSTI